jgi:hypothetical protein
MIRAHGNLRIDTIFDGAPLFLGHDGGDDGNQICVAIEMIGLVERTFLFMPCVAQMNEMNARCEFHGHGHQVVVGI